MAPVLIVPGIGGSGPQHWQSRWELVDPTLARVQMPDWDHPELEAWVAELEQAVNTARQPPVIVAHSLGCLAVAHWAARGGHALGALLVAVPDPQGPSFPSVASSFGPVPKVHMPFASRVVASRNDPFGSFAFAQRCALAWGSALTDAGEAGHINAESGLGDWDAGRVLLASLR